MRCHLSKAISIFTIFLIGWSCASAEQLGVFVGFGANFKPGESIRVSYGPYEVGLLADQAMGLVKNFKSDNKYASLGLATNGGSGGLFAAMGLETELFWGLHLRGELYALSYVNGFSRGRGLIGLSYYF